MVVNFVERDVLEDVVVTREIHVGLAFFKKWLELGDELPRVAVLASSARMDGEMALDNLPISSTEGAGVSARLMQHHRATE